MRLKVAALVLAVLFACSLPSSSAASEDKDGVPEVTVPNVLHVNAATAAVWFEDKHHVLADVEVFGVTSAASGFDLVAPSGVVVFQNQSSTYAGVVSFWHQALVPGTYTVYGPMERVRARLVSFDASPYSPAMGPAAQCAVFANLARSLTPSTDTSCVPRVETHVPDVGTCPAPKVGVVVDGASYCVNGVTSPCRQASDCIDYVCSFMDPACDLDPRVPSVQACQSPKVGVVVDGTPHCVNGVTPPCGSAAACIDYVCSFTEEGCDFNPPSVQVCQSPKLGVIVNGVPHCLDAGPTPKPCTSGIGIQPDCHMVRLCDGGNVGLEVDGSSLFCQPVSVLEPCPDNSYGFNGNCHTVEPCSNGRTGYAVDGASAGCVFGPGGVSPPGGGPGVGAELGMEVMRAAPPDAEDSQTLAAIAAAPKCRATPALRHHDVLGIDIQGLLLSCPNYSQLIPSTVAPPSPPKVPDVPSVPMPEHVKVDLIKKESQASAVTSETIDCSADPGSAAGNTRLWYTVYADDYFWKTHYGRNGEPDDAEEFVSNIHAFWTTRSDGRWQTHVTQPVAPTCPRWILPMPHGEVDSVHTAADLAALRAYEDGFSDKGQIVAAMGVGQIEYEEGGQRSTAHGLTIGGPVSDLGNPPALYFNGADSPFHADRVFTHEMGHAFGVGHTRCDENMAGHDGGSWVHIMAYSQNRDPTCKPFSGEQHWHWIFKGPDAADVHTEYAAWCAAVGGADCAP